MNLLLFICLCVLSREIATAADDTSTNESTTPPAIPETKSTTPDSTVQPGTSPPLIHTTKSTKVVPEIGNVACAGWCLDKLKPVHTLNLTVNHTLDEKRLKTFYLLKAKIENADAYSVRLDANLFADKNEYYDRDRERALIFNKNVLSIPTTIFFPLTRSAVKKAIMNSGNVYVPNMGRSPAAVKLLQTRENSPFAFLWNQPVFTNRYFESNPLLHYNMEVSSNRKANTILKRKTNTDFNDPYNIGNRKPSVSFDYSDGIEQPMRKANPEPLRSGKLFDFINNGYNGIQKKRAQQNKALSPWEVNNILGVLNEETILEHAPNTVQDIIGGMKIRGKNIDTFVIGNTQNARNKILKWVGQKYRSKKLPNSHDTGIYLNGKSRSSTMDLLLKSMVQSYQYGDNMPTYKKLSPN